MVKSIFFSLISQLIKINYHKNNFNKYTKIYCNLVGIRNGPKQVTANGPV